MTSLSTLGTRGRPRSWFPSSFHSPLFSSPPAFVPSSNATTDDRFALRKATDTNVERPLVSSQSHREGTISVTTPDLLPTNPDQGSRDSFRRWQQEDSVKSKELTEIPILPPRFHPELFSSVSAFIPSNNPDRVAVIGCKPLTQANTLAIFRQILMLNMLQQEWSASMLEKCKEKRLNILLKNPSEECDQCQLKCFNEKEIKGVLSEARASQAAFSAEKRSEGLSFSERKVMLSDFESNIWSTMLK